MTNEELAVRIQQGERELLPELWEQVAGFVKYMANKLLQRLPEPAAVEFDDLYHSGYIAFVKAVEGFDAERDCTFVTLLSFTLKTAFAEATGYRTKKQQQDPLHHAQRFETPLQGIEDVRFGDTIPDAAAEAAFEDAERKLFIQQLRLALDTALAHLTPQQYAVIKGRFCEDRTTEEMASEMDVTGQTVREAERKAFRVLRRPGIVKDLRAFAFPDIERRIHEKTNYFYHVSEERFNSTGSSAVEELVFKREEWRQRDIGKSLKDRPDLIDELIYRSNYHD